MGFRLTVKYKVPDHLWLGARPAPHWENNPCLFPPALCTSKRQPRLFCSAGVQVVQVQAKASPPCPMVFEKTSIHTSYQHTFIGPKAKHGKRRLKRLWTTHLSVSFFSQPPGPPFKLRIRLWGNSLSTRYTSQSSSLSCCSPPYRFTNLFDVLCRLIWGRTISEITRATHPDHFQSSNRIFRVGCSIVLLDLRHTSLLEGSHDTLSLPLATTILSLGLHGALECRLCPRPSFDCCYRPHKTRLQPRPATPSTIDSTCACIRATVARLIPHPHAAVLCIYMSSHIQPTSSGRRTRAQEWRHEYGLFLSDLPLLQTWLSSSSTHTTLRLPGPLPEPFFDMSRPTPCKLYCTYLCHHKMS